MSLGTLRKLIFVFSLAGASTTSAQIPIIDQQNLNDEQLVASPSVGFSQSFTPSVTALNTVEVILFVSGAQNITLQLTLFTGNGLGFPILGNSDLVIVSPADGPIPLEFRFRAPVPVVPGKVYTFHIHSPSSVPFSIRYGSDTYAGGNMFDSYYIYPARDLYFREGLSVPAPTITRLSDQQIRLQGKALPSSSVTISVSADLSENSFVFIGTSNTDAYGTWQYNDTPSPESASRFYRVTAP